MTKMKKTTQTKKIDEFVMLEGFNKAILGAVDVYYGGKKIKKLVYDADLMVQILVERDGMNEEEALEFIDFNVENAYMGDDAPLVMWKNFSLFGHIFDRREKDLNDLIKNTLNGYGNGSN